ncbi:MAG: hypothetical protein ACRDFB_03295 [Rhabdochlamydiaceae bacterium]
MLVKIKEWESADKRGYPRAEMWSRLVHGGDILEIEDTPVVHMAESEYEKDQKTGRPILERKVTHYQNVSLNPNQKEVKEMTELEYRQWLLKTSMIGQRWSKENKELFLKYYHFSPEVMEPAPRNARPTVFKGDSLPEESGRFIPDSAPGQKTSLGTIDTGGFAGALKKLNQDEAVNIVNKTDDVKTLEIWLEEEKGGNRDRVINTIKTQLRTVNAV